MIPLAISLAIVCADDPAGQLRPDPIRPDQRLIVGVPKRDNDWVMVQVDGRAAMWVPRQLVEKTKLPSDEELKAIDVDRGLANIVQKLNAPEWSVRDQAAKDLRESSASVVQLLAALISMDLSLEQRSRLVEEARLRVVEAPRGALGIEFLPAGRGGIVVKNCIDGMPAQKVLREQDRIVMVEDEPILDSTELGLVVQTKRPGDTVRLIVMRPRRDERGALVVDDRFQLVEDRLEIMLELGSFDDLERFNELGVRQQQWVRAGGDATQMISLVRSAQARELLERFLPKPITVPDDPTIAEPGDDENADELHNVRAHPYIVRLLQDVELINAGSITATEPLREKWRAMKNDLIRQTMDSRLAEADREYLFRVRDEFDRLLPD